jgi:uncharacterized protein YegL
MRKLTRNLLRGAAAMALCAAAGMSHATPVTFDIVFLLDASGSVGSAQFHSERQLINTIHDQFVALAPADHSVNYRFGVIEFATTASVKQHLDTAYSATLVDNLNYVMGYSHLKDAVQGGLDLFTTEGATSDIRQMFLFTDGIPNPSSTQNPSSLAPALDAANVNVTALGLQDFNDVIVHSLVDDRARDEIMATSYTAANTKEINDRLLAPASAPAPAAAVPEPGSLALLLAGLGAAVPLVRRRRGICATRSVAFKNNPSQR